MTILQALLRTHESFDKDELVEIAEEYLSFSVDHLTVNQIKNVLVENLSAGVEVLNPVSWIDAYCEAYHA